MFDPIARSAWRALLNTIAHPRLRAVLAGSGLGWVAWELSQVPDRPAFNLAMALVVVFAGSASFVLHSLHVQAVKTRPSAGERLAEARLSLSLLGCGVALSMQLLQRVLA